MYHCTVNPLFDWFGLVCFVNKIKIVGCHTADSKPVKQEVNGTVILHPLVFGLHYSVDVYGLTSVIIFLPGRSNGDCSTKDLKSLIDTLKIDIKNLVTTSYNFLGWEETNPSNIRKHPYQHPQKAIGILP